jgi:hypothetical protein
MEPIQPLLSKTATPFPHRHAVATEFGRDLDIRRPLSRSQNHPTTER